VVYFEVLDDELLPGVGLLMPLVLPVVPEVDAPPVLSLLLPVPLVPLEPGVLLLLLPGVEGAGVVLAPGVLLVPAALLLSVPLEPPAVPVLPALLPPLALGVSVLLPALPVGGVVGVLGVLGVVAVLPALLLSAASFFPHAPSARVATKAASNTECFIFIPLKRCIFKQELTWLVG
jgi:hypothetical protein